MSNDPTKNDERPWWLKICDLIPSSPDPRKFIRTCEHCGSDGDVRNDRDFLHGEETICTHCLWLHGEEKLEELDALPFPQNMEAKMNSPWDRHYEAKFVLFERRGGDPWNEAGLVVSGIAGVCMFAMVVFIAFMALYAVIVG